MGIVLFFVLALLVAAAIVYPMLPASSRSTGGRAAAAWATGATEEQIEGAVRRLRRARAASPVGGSDARACPACGQAYQPGDRFCVRCGGALPARPGAEPSEAARPTCRSCGAALNEGDQFCVKCGEAQ